MDELTYDALRRVQQKERSTGMLGELPEDFYEKAGELVARMKREMGEGFALEKAKEYENALKVIRDIYSVREQKILFKALRGAKGGDGISGVAREELEMYGKIRDAIADCEGIFERVIGNSAERKAEAPAKPASAVRQLKALADIPQFVGVDGVKYGPFRKDEAVVVPQRVAELLLKRKMAAE